MVAVQNIKGEIIQLILSQKGGGMYLVSATPPKRLIGINETLHTYNTLPADVHEGIWFLSKIWKVM